MKIKYYIPRYKNVNAANSSKLMTLRMFFKRALREQPGRVIYNAREDTRNH